MKTRLSIFILLFCLLTILLGLFTGCRSEKQQKPQQGEQAAETPQAVTPNDTSPQAEEKPIDTQKATPPVSFEGLPTAFPDVFTPENKDVWNTIFKTCIKHPEYLGSLLPSTAKEALELYYKSTSPYMYNDTSIAFHKLYAEAMFERFPDDLRLLHSVDGAWTPNINTPREDVLIFIEMGEHIQRLCDEQNLPPTSQWSVIRNLTNAYVYVGEYRKAAQNKRETLMIVDHAKKTGNFHEGLLRAISAKPVFWLEQKAAEQEQQQKQSK